MPLLKSWIASADRSDGQFLLNNLPYGVFSNGNEPRCGVAIGDIILDVTLLEEESIVTVDGGPVFDVPFWNDFMELGPSAWAALRARLTDLLSAGGDPAIRETEGLAARALVRQTTLTTDRPPKEPPHEQSLRLTRRHDRKEHQLYRSW